MRFWSVGAAQYLDNAETMLYIVYQHADGDVLVGQDTEALISRPCSR